MKRKTLYVSLIITVAATGGIALAEDKRGFGSRDGEPTVQQARFGGHDRGEHRGHSRGKARIEAMMEAYDQNQDGALTQAEIDAVRSDRLQTFDSNGDGNLSLAEYEALWLDAMRERMVDQFQRHDDDGDGLVTQDEFGEHYSKMVARMDRNDDGKIDPDDFQRHRSDRRGGPGQETSE